MIQIKELDQITREDFQAYEGVRASEVINMFEKQGPELAGLDVATYLGIMAHYTELTKRYPGVRR